MKRLPLLLAAAATLLVAIASAQPTSNNPPVERAFAAGGAVQLNLAAADYRIVGRAEPKIRVSWRVDHSEDAGRVHVETDVRGTTATIRTTGPKNGLHFQIELPERSDVNVELSAGDLEVRGIEGNKSLSMWAGDVSIDVGSPDLYREVEASVRFGDISARPFQISKGGIFRSFRWTGKGRYSVRARLFAGDLTLR
jgi:hypothetical protein